MASAERAPQDTGVDADGYPIGAGGTAFPPSIGTGITGERTRVRDDTATVTGGDQRAGSDLLSSPPGDDRTGPSDHPGPSDGLRHTAGEVRHPASPEQPNPGIGPGGTGRSRPATHPLPEPPPLTVSLCEQGWIERIPLTDVGVGIGGESTEQDCAVVLHTARPAAAADTGAERIGLSTIDAGAGHDTVTGDAGEPGIGFDDTGVVRSVN